MAENDTLEKLYEYLELNTVTDHRLKLKALLMKKVLFLTSQWKEGFLSEWTDKLANRCSLSTRKIRENYIDPLITEGILQRLGNGRIKFVGLPPNATMPIELTEEQLKEELAEENEMRAQLGKPKISLEEWRQKRSERMKPLP